MYIASNLTLCIDKKCDMKKCGKINIYLLIKKCFLPKTVNLLFIHSCEFVGMSGNFTSQCKAEQD